jgi:di/tricarboxylate transporter
MKYLKYFFIILLMFIFSVNVQAQQPANTNFYNLNNVSGVNNTLNPELNLTNNPIYGPVKGNVNTPKETSSRFHVVQCKTDPCTFEDAIEIINRLVNWFVSIAATIGAITVAYAGAQILLNPGNAGKLEDAKKMFYKTLIGLFWLLAAWLVIYTIIDKFVSPSTNALRFLKN